ncbi:glycosyltransferase family 61 protein [Tautonia plasticadhaerens]|uniref:Glycosyltransferase 61 catalytic domain-containing protein n=1 Tax=Tautonia plasticadhaerens TaxID=2527974 RepID=A0A518GW83_9BACT|nr:glycosyltransferase family 61 protein [Tautonia plasticadhaerens]QDV32801.1 hypothetical protein ElP_06410 [Tautonia plasticadhaerens]
MELQLSRPLPDIDVPESILFGYPTRMVDSWKPQIERILLRAERKQGAEFRVEVARGRTDRAGQLRSAIRGPWDLKRRSKYERARKLPAIDCGETLLYDLRWEADTNPAHALLRGTAALLARRLIAERTGEDAPVVAVLRENASPIGRWIFDRLGVPHRASDRELTGRIVQCDSPYDYPLNNPTILGGLGLDPGGPTPPRVFVARRGARALLNEDLVAEHLARRGFERIYCEDLPFDRQLALLGNAREVVGIHGAGLSWLGFNPRGTGPDAPPRSGIRLVELFGPGYLVDCYRIMMSCSRASYAAVRGQITPEVVRDLDQLGRPRSHVNSPFRVDLGTLDEALDLVGAGAD